MCAHQRAPSVDACEKNSAIPARDRNFSFMMWGSDDACDQPAWPDAALLADRACASRLLASRSLIAVAPLTKRMSPSMRSYISAPTVRLGLGESRSAPGSRSRLAFVDVPLDVRQPGLDEAGGVAHALVVDRRSEFAHEEVEQRLGAKVAKLVVELDAAVVLDCPQERGAPFR